MNEEQGWEGLEQQCMWEEAGGGMNMIHIPSVNFQRINKNKKQKSRADAGQSEDKELTLGTPDLAAGAKGKGQCQSQ